MTPRPPGDAEPDPLRPGAPGADAPVADPPPRSAPPIPPARAALLGIVSVGAAVGVGHLAAAVVAPAASPPLAVSDAVVRLAPLPLVEFATATFGTADKAVLGTGVAVLLLVIAALAGLATRRRPTPAVAVVVALGLVAAAAAWTAPAFAQLDVVPSLVAGLTGVWAVRFLHRRALHDAEAAAVHAENVRSSQEPGGLRQPDERGDDGATVPPGTAPPAASAPAVARRSVLTGSTAALAAVGAGALAAGGAGALLTRGTGDSRAAVTARLGAVPVAPAPALPSGADLTAFGAPPVITSNADFYRIDTALRVPALDAADWTLRVHGLVDRPLTLSFADLVARPLVERTLTMTCVSNDVGGDLVSTARFVGVDLRDLLLEAGVRDGADQLLSTAVDGWTAGTPTAVVLEPDRGALLAIGMNGESLPREHGFPVRMVVPGLYGYVSATKWLTDLELTTFATQSYWVQRGWGVRGPVKTQSRIDAPRAFARVTAGRVTVAGVAWAQHVGVDRVEVRADGGPWRDAQLGTEVNRDTWRMWRAELDLPPGRHEVQCRATDRSGATQPEERTSPVPDGATGWHTVGVTVS